jgi:hypothetical protein
MTASEIFYTTDGIHRMIWGMEGREALLWPVEQWVEIIEAIEMTKQVAIYRMNQRIENDRQK